MATTKVKISDSTSTTSSEIAASCTAVKTVMDKANSINSSAVKTSGNQTIAGTKTFSSTISGSINGTAAKATSDVNGLNIVSNYYHKGCGTNYSPSEDTTSVWAEKAPGHYWYTTNGILTDQPSQYGHLMNFGQDTEIFQLWCCAPTGPLYFRSGNASGGWNNTTWKKIMDKSSDNTMPNWSAGVAKSLGVLYTAEQDGFITFYMQNPDDKTSTLVINGITYTFNFRTSSTESGKQSALYQFAIPKGITYQANSYGELKFYPCK